METEEKIIFNIQIDQSDSVNKIANLTKEIDALKAANKQLAAQEGDNTKAITENNLLIKQATDERGRQSKAVLASMDAFGKEAKSIDDARSAVKQLTIERNKLDISTAEGKKRQTELNNSIDAHNKFIKENVDQYQQQKINIGNYASALGGSNTVLGQSIAKFQAMKEALKLGKEAVAGIEIQQASFNTVLKANIIGIIIVALTSLYALFTKFDPVVDKINALFAGFSAVISVATNRLIEFGKGTIEVVIGYFNGLINVAKSLFQILSGDFKAGFDNLKGSFNEMGAAITKTSNSFVGMGAEMSKAAQEAYALEEALQALEDRTTAQIVINAQAEQQINRLILQSKNRTLTDNERLALIDKASKIEKDNFEQNKKIAEEKYQIDLKNYARTANLTTKEIEELMTNTKRRDEIQAKAGQISGGEIKKLAEQKAGIVKLETESIQLQEKLNNRREALLDGAQKKREENNAKQKTSSDKSNAAFQKEVEDMEKLLIDAGDKLIERERLLAKQRVEVTQEKNKAILEDEKAALDEKQKINQADIQSSVAVANAAKGVIGELANAAAQGSEIQKALALTNVAINLGTAIGNLTATTTSAASVDNILTGGVAGFVKYAAFLAQVTASITSARNIIGGAAAGGGDFMTSGPTMLLVGDNPGGRERVTVEPISGRGQTTINPNSGLIAMAGGGTLTTTGYGGYAQRNGNKSGLIDYDLLANAFSKLPQPTLMISEFNKAQKDQSQVKVKASL